MDFNFAVVCVLELTHREGAKTSTVKEVNFSLNPSKNLKQSMYLGENNLPTKLGYHAISSVLTQGLIGVIHGAHQAGYKNDAEHIQEVIKELGRGFVQHATVDHKPWDENNKSDETELSTFIDEIVSKVNHRKKGVLKEKLKHHGSKCMRDGVSLADIKIMFKDLVDLY